MNSKTSPSKLLSEFSSEVIKPTLRQKRTYPYLALIAAAVAIILIVSILVGKPKDFEGYVKTSGYLGVLLMGILGSTSPIWPLPGSWAAFIGGGLGLNPFLLALSAGIGEPLGETTAYLGGYGGQVAIKKWKRYAQIESWMRRRGRITIFLLSAVPNFAIKLAVVVAGALRYPWWRFFLFCWAGKTLKSLGFALAGAGLFTFVLNLLKMIF